MNAHSALVDAVQMTGLLAVEIAIVILAAACLQPIIKSTQWRRTLWQVCVLTVTLITVVEFSGFGREAARLTFRAIRSNLEQPHSKAVLPRSFATELSSPSAPIAEIAGEPQVIALMPESQMTDSHAVQRSQRSTSSFETIVPWAAFVWLLGTGLLLCRTIVARIMLVFLRRGSRRVEDPGLQSLVRDLSAQSGIRGQVEVLECKRLRSPVAFGLFAKVIGLPRGFAADHSDREQAVMLAHELAHLAGHDPWWCLLAETATALLWWHPLVWFARRRLQQATESAADEASLLVENGPPLLAKCLVTLGRRLQTPDSLGWLHIGGGFYSGLGRRVENLLRLSEPTWRPANRFRMRLAKMLFPIALVLVAAMCSGWISPGSLTKESNMKDQMWRRSLPAFALLALLNGDQQLAAADKTNQPQTVVAATDAKPDPLMARNVAPPQKRKGAEAVRKRLQQIVFDNVQCDNLPLGAVINMLIDETTKRDPDRVGVNFLLRNTLESGPSPAIDPSTGLPIPGTAEALDLGSVTIRIIPPLRNVRLIDVLDAMVKVADRPIAYSIEEYGVIFSFGSSSRSAQNFETRTFAITPAENFFKGIEAAFGINAPDKVEGTAGRERSRQMQQEIFQDLFAQLGIDWAPPKGAFYNELTGIVMVRAAAEDMPVVTAAMQTLGGNQIGGN